MGTGSTDYTDITIPVRFHLWPHRPQRGYNPESGWAVTHMLPAIPRVGDFVELAMPDPKVEESYEVVRVLWRPHEALSNCVHVFVVTHHGKRWE